MVRLCGRTGVIPRLECYKSTEARNSKFVEHTHDEHLPPNVLYVDG